VTGIKVRMGGDRPKRAACGPDNSVFAVVTGAPDPGFVRVDAFETRRTEVLWRIFVFIDDNRMGIQQ
jgi:hypothetical protein